ncbi:MATE family efflux transporter [Vibrio taketomensis]|uniref:MATE family efflux transporter n=1 Tax=Vibrio taketomensis TaxID=2572923 RepID=UPI001389C82B|nr:MATE family efflux transporter [Vibrio taketomensis]
MSSLPNAIDKRMSIVALTWPLFIEIMLRTALNTSDVFMLSGYSDQAVSAVGVIAQIAFFLIIICTMVSSGTGILIAQYNGSDRHTESAQVAIASIIMAAIVGAFLSVFSVIGAHHLLPYYGLETQVLLYAQEYLLISGSMTFNVSMGIVLTTILRSHGYSRSPMVINLIAGVVNIIGNYIALYQPFGLPVYGVQGVAVATVVSQVLSTILLYFKLRKTDIQLPFSQWRTIPRSIYQRIVRIGIMNASETLAYNLAQLTIIYFVVQMGTASLAAYTYAQNIARVSFAFALAIGQGSQIQAGYFIGRGWIDAILGKVQKYFVVGFIVTNVVTIGTYLLKDQIIPLFTDQPEIAALTASLIAGSILLEAGRVFNLIFIASLKAAGDIQFPVKMGIFSMWGIGVVFSYLLGVHLGYGVLGAWIAIAMDEWFRGLIMAKRWRSKVWTRYQLT